MFPALRVGGIKVFGVTVCHSRATTAETQQFTLIAFLEPLVLAVGVHLLTVEHVKKFLIDRAHIALEAAAGHEPPLGSNGEMAVGTVAATIDGVVCKALRHLEQPFLIEIECPQVVFEVERGAAVLVALIPFPTILKQLAVSLRLNVPAHVRRNLVFARGAVTPEGENVNVALYHEVDDVGDFVNIGARHGGHDSTMKTRVADSIYCFKCAVERAGFTESVVGVSHAVNAQLVLAASQRLEPPANLIGQVERIPHDGEWDAVAVH